MHREGHIGLSCLIYSPIAFLLAYFGYQAVLGIGFVGFVLLSTAPDYDFKIPFVKHRGITHTYLAAVVVGLFFGGLGIASVQYDVAGTFSVGLQQTPVDYLIAGGFGFFIGFVGIGSHLLGDSFTPMGVKPYQPFSDEKITYDLFLSKSMYANAGFLFLGMVSMILAVGGGLWISQNGIVLPV